MSKETKAKMYSIYKEGYRITGGSGGAEFVGNCEGTSFVDACSRFFNADNLYNKDSNTLWGCRLFETLRDAQVNFG